MNANTKLYKPVYNVSQELYARKNAIIIEYNMNFFIEITL